MIRAIFAVCAALGSAVPLTTMDASNHVDERLDALEKKAAAMDDG